MPNYDVPTPAPFLPQPGRPARPWRLWRDYFVDVFLVAAGGDDKPISPKVSKALLISCLGEEGQRIFNTLPPVVKRESDTEFDVILCQLDQFFEPKTNVIVERFSFRQRGQQVGESTAEYVSVLRGLAKFCAYGEMEDELIRDMVVEKTVHPRLREKYLLDSALTLDKVLSLGEAYERSLQQASLMTGQGHDHATVAKVYPSPSRRPSSKPQPPSPETACGNCGLSDHATRAPQCPARRVVCHACGRKGHYAVVCRNPTPPEAAATQLLQKLPQPLLRRRNLTSGGSLLVSGSLLG